MSEFKEPQIYEAILAHIDVAVTLIDVDGYFVYANDKYCQLYGYTREQLIGKHFNVLVPEDQKQETLLLNQEFLEKGGRLSMERRRVKQDGSPIDVNAVFELISAGDRKMIMVTVADISEMTRIRQQLILHEERYRTILEDSAAKSEELRKLIMNAALDAIICIDKNDKVTLWNPQAEKIFGWSKEETEGRGLSELIIPVEYRERHKQGMKHYLKTGKGAALNVLLELTAINRAGHEFPIELTVLPIKQEGEEEIFCAFIRDITQRKKNESILKDLNAAMARNIEELAQSNIELEQYAYIASHDLQEPLRMVTSFLTQLEKKYDGILDDRGRQYLHFAVDGAVRMRKIILDLLEYSKVDKIDDDLEDVDMNDLLEDIVRLNRSVIEEQQAKIISDDLPTIKARKVLIQQVFQNLVGNALKYCKPGVAPVIEVSADEDHSFWKFWIRDNGIGIDSQFYDKIFVLFQRLHNKEEFSGTGIGLAICKKIIERHGGSISVDSHPGNGSTFYFTIKK